MPMTLDGIVHAFIHGSETRLTMESPFEDRQRRLAADGLAFPCSMCLHQHRFAFGDGPADACGPCGGPLAGREFPNYDGPASRAYVVLEHCVVCGCAAEGTLERPVPTGPPLRWGICRSCMRCNALGLRRGR